MNQSRHVTRQGGTVSVTLERVRRRPRRKEGRKERFFKPLQTSIRLLSIQTIPAHRDVQTTAGLSKVLLLSWQCYMFHMYVGVRAGGGIGDELEDPAGDPYELYRILFDITFFFFVIVILLAIIQGRWPPGRASAPRARPETLVVVCFRFDHRRVRRAEGPAGAGEGGHGGEKRHRI